MRFNRAGVYKQTVFKTIPLHPFYWNLKTFSNLVVAYVIWCLFVCFVEFICTKFKKKKIFPKRSELSDVTDVWLQSTRLSVAC